MVHPEGKPSGCFDQKAVPQKGTNDQFFLSIGQRFASRQPGKMRFHDKSPSLGIVH